MKRLADVQIDPGDKDSNISLEKLTGKKVTRVEGYPSRTFDVPTFRLTSITLEGGTKLFVEGEHDHAYLCENDKVKGLDEETLLALCREMNGEDDEGDDDE